ncbi:MAG: hypothetical protein J0665_04320 [Deltaproteobacteria bacterium]|nr:hypothetical protein [Deltaproteobacteria bacterium]
MSDNGGKNSDTGEGTPHNRDIVQGFGTTHDRSLSERTVGTLPFTFEDIPSRQPLTAPPTPPHEPPPASSGGDIPSNCPPNFDLGTDGDTLWPVPLEGVVTLVQRTEEEPPPNWYRTLSKGIMMIFVLPIFVTFGLASFALSIAFAIIGFQALSSLFNPVSWMTAIFEFMEVFVLGRLQRSSQHTVYRGLVRDDSDRIYAFYLQGALRSGLLVDGHQVRLFGEWQRTNRRGEDERGTLLVSRGEDRTTGSSILSLRNGWRPVFFVLLATLFAVMVTGVIYLPQLTQDGSTLFNSIPR